MRETVRVLLHTTMISSIFACNDGSFKAETGRENVPPPKSVSADVREVAFGLTGEDRRKLDMIWVIDNSGSMANEIDHVRKNFDKFLSSVSSMSDLKLALVSDSGDDVLPELGIKLGDQWLKQGFQQIDQMVFSTDSLLLLSAGTCGQNIDQLGTDNGPCGISSNNSDDDFNRYLSFTTRFDSNGEISNLKKFYREGAKRTFVFVTDDDSLILSSSDFIKAVTSSMSPISNVEEMSVFGFVGTSSNRCNVASVGKQYINLANELGGKVYDICESDWTGNFGDLTKQVENFVKAEYTLDNEGGTIVIAEVLLDKKLLSVSDYTLKDNKTIVVNSDVLGADSSEVVIKYSIK